METDRSSRLIGCDRPMEATHDALRDGSGGLPVWDSDGPVLGVLRCLADGGKGESQ